MSQNLESVIQKLIDINGKQNPIFQTGKTSAIGHNKVIQVVVGNKRVNALAWNIKKPGEVTVFWDEKNKRYVAWEGAKGGVGGKRTTTLALRKTRPEEKQESYIHAVLSKVSEEDLYIIWGFPKPSEYEDVILSDIVFLNNFNPINKNQYKLVWSIKNANIDIKIYILNNEQNTINLVTFEKTDFLNNTIPNIKSYNNYNLLLGQHITSTTDNKLRISCTRSDGQPNLTFNRSNVDLNWFLNRYVNSPAISVSYSNGGSGTYLLSSLFTEPEKDVIVEGTYSFTASPESTNENGVTSSSSDFTGNLIVKKPIVFYKVNNQTLETLLYYSEQEANQSAGYSYSVPGSESNYNQTTLTEVLDITPTIWENNALNELFKMSKNNSFDYDNNYQRLTPPTEFYTYFVPDREEVINGSNSTSTTTVLTTQNKIQSEIIKNVFVNNANLIYTVVKEVDLVDNYTRNYTYLTEYIDEAGYYATTDSWGILGALGIGSGSYNQFYSKRVLNQTTNDSIYNIQTCNNLELGYNKYGELHINNTLYTIEDFDNEFVLLVNTTNNNNLKTHIQTESIKPIEEQLPYFEVIDKTLFTLVVGCDFNQDSYKFKEITTQTVLDYNLYRYSSSAGANSLEYINNVTGQDLVRTFTINPQSDFHVVNQEVTAICAIDSKYYKCEGVVNVSEVENDTDVNIVFQSNSYNAKRTTLKSINLTLTKFEKVKCAGLTENNKLTVIPKNNYTKLILHKLSTTDASNLQIYTNETNTYVSATNVVVETDINKGRKKVFYSDVYKFDTTTQKFIFDKFIKSDLKKSPKLSSVHSDNVSIYNWYKKS